MQTITPELEAILKDRFQAGAQGFRARVELDVVIPAHTDPDTLTNIAPTGTVTGSGIFPPSDPTYANDGSTLTSTGAESFASAGPRTISTIWVLDLGAPAQVTRMDIVEEPFWGFDAVHMSGSADGVDWTVFDSPDITVTYDAGTWTYTFAVPQTYQYWRAYLDRSLVSPGIQYVPNKYMSEWRVYAATTTPAEVSTIILPQPSSISIDKSLRMAADQATVEIPNEHQLLGWGPDSQVVTNSRLRVFQWFGDEANAVQTFEGLVDGIGDHRDVLTTTLTCRDMFALLIDQTFSATAPQTAGETGAVRTAANGVYLSMEVSDIVSDILDRAGWPTDDRAITETSYVLDEFIVSDGASWADTIIGDERLTGLVGYSAWADELGVFHFAPTGISQNLTEPVEAVYTFRTGEDIVALDDRTDQYDLRTRVKVRGPLTTQTLTDTWRELWRTTKITKPVGLWYAPAEPTILRVISRATKRMYRLRQSDRAVLGSVYLGGVIPYPLGLSGDPADATIYWVLNAPWIYTGSTSGNSVKKVRKSDNVVLASYSLPSGKWSALKASSSYLYLTNLTTDRFYRRSKTDASAVADYSHTYASTSQLNPSGMMIDGSTLYVFWSNSGTTARFLKCAESAPGTVTGVVKTAGTALHGGEMDTTTHTECYGDADDLNLVTKDTLLEAVSQTNQVYAEVVDTDLEDELGSLAQSQDREHDTHPGDADHPFEIRRMTLDLSVITNLAQATQTAQRQLDLASIRRRVLDVGIIGNPALQKTDPVAVVDPVTGLSDSFAIDTYRSQMSADGTYVGTLALLPVAALDDDPTDDGDATE